MRRMLGQVAPTHQRPLLSAASRSVWLCRAGLPTPSVGSSAQSAAMAAMAASATGVNSGGDGDMTMAMAAARRDGGSRS